MSEQETAKRTRGPRKTLEQQLRARRDALLKQVTELRVAERELEKVEKALEAFADVSVSEAR